MQIAGYFWSDAKRGVSGSGSIWILRGVISILVTFTLLSKADDCQLRPVMHVLKFPNCRVHVIPSFACQGTCSSYVEVSGSKFWQVERSCMCCQEMGEREAEITIFCPNPKKSPFRKVITRAPVECMCRPCTAVDDKLIHPQEVAEKQVKQE
ncbi:bursicon-like [Limulus polyphemus]|uniref:Bursicon n=1 Tax=Limulus polyphemus TaxID=6850 RepID=A0ABM1BZK8_LIMPO|nr:bursicon-like [Limulus polyphemus]